MRVVCIKDSNQIRKDVPKVKKGVIYTVLRQVDLEDVEIPKGRRLRKGKYFILMECGSDNCYHHSIFVEINDDQQDETMMQRDYNKEKVFS